jgi:hypothetical protein
LIGDGSSRTGLFIGYLIGGGIMIFGGIIEIIFGINAEGEIARDGDETAHLDRGTGLGRDTGTRLGLRVGCILDAALLQGGPR